MSAFSGRQGRGAARVRRVLKREQAEARNAMTPHVRSRQHRVQCEVTPEARLLCAIFGKSA